MSLQPRILHLSLGVVVVLAMALLCAVVLPVWKPLFFAAVFASILYTPFEWVTRRTGNRPVAAAGFMTTGVFFLVLVPFVTLASVIIRQGLAAYSFIRDALAEGGLAALAAKLPDRLEGPFLDIVKALPVDVDRLTTEVASHSPVTPALVGDAVNNLAHFGFSMAMFLVAFCALLLHGPELLSWANRVIPLPAGEASELFSEFRNVSRSVIRSSLLTAAVQGLFATVGYLIAGVPNPLFFGVVTFFAAFVPFVGPSLVALPLAALVFFSGGVWQGIFLAVWAITIGAVAENVLKPLLIQDQIEIQGVVVLFSIIGGVIAFGAVGFLVGPLAVSFFLAVTRFAGREFIESP